MSKEFWAGTFFDKLRHFRDLVLSKKTVSTYLFFTNIPEAKYPNRLPMICISMYNNEDEFRLG